MQATPAAVLDALKIVRDRDLNRDIVSLGFIKDLKVDAGRVAFTIELTTPACPVKDQMRDQARVAVNLALALSQCGSKVGIIDGDIYGPNVPMMLGLRTELTTDGQKIVPAEKYGLQIVSMGFLTEEDAAVI